MKRKKNLYLTGTYILLTVLAVIWLISIIWIFLKFPCEGANAVPYFFPKTYTLITTLNCLPAMLIHLENGSSIPSSLPHVHVSSTLITVGMASH